MICSFVYVQPNSSAKEIFWFHLAEMARVIDKPCLVMGDFNDFANMGERKGGHSDCFDRIVKFRERWNYCGLMDPGSIGFPFTWIRRRHNVIILQERLDRLLWNDKAMLLFPEAKVANLPRTCSDHHPIAFSSDVRVPPNIELRPFRFEAACLTHKRFINCLRLCLEPP